MRNASPPENRVGTGQHAHCRPLPTRTEPLGAPCRFAASLGRAKADMEREARRVGRSSAQHPLAARRARSMSLIFANWFKPPSEEATEGEGGASSSSTRDDAGASSSSSVHVDGWRLPRPSEGVRSRRESRDLHAWPAPTPTPHTPSLLHRSGGLPGLLTTVCLHPPTLERLSLRARANGRACRSLAPTSLPPACVSRADQHLSCQNPSPSPSPSPSPTLQQTTLRSPSPTLQQTSLRRRGSSRASSCSRR